MNVEKPHAWRWKLSISKVSDLNGALETYYEKWIKGKNENAEIIRKTDALLLAEKKQEVFIATTPEPTMGAEYIRVKPAVDLKPAFLECDCAMVKVNQFLDQAYHCISSGLKNNKR